MLLGTRLTSPFSSLPGFSVWWLFEGLASLNVMSPVDGSFSGSLISVIPLNAQLIKFLQQTFCFIVSSFSVSSSFCFTRCPIWACFPVLVSCKSLIPDCYYIGLLIIGVILKEILHFRWGSSTSINNHTICLTSITCTSAGASCFFTSHPPWRQAPWS